MLLSYYLTTHNTPADNRPPSNRGRSRGRSGGMALNNNSMYGDERLGVGACTSLSPTRNMRSRKNRGAGFIGFGNENNSSSNSPNPKKKGMFYIHTFLY